MPKLLKFFLVIATGNFISKVFFLISDGLVLYGLGVEQFGVLAFIQSLVLAFSIVAVWGSEQAMISMIGRIKTRGDDIRPHIRRARRLITLRSILLIAVAWVIIYFSKLVAHWPVYGLCALIILIEPHLIFNSAVLRAASVGRAAIAYLDGFRNFGLLLGAAWLTWGHSAWGYDFLLYIWAFTGVVSFARSRGIIQTEIVNLSGSPVPNEDISHVKNIAKFSGIWSVVQISISRFTVMFSGFLFSAAQLGVIGFFMKLIVVFTFLQTVIIQTLAAVIGGFSQETSRDDAARVFSLTTLFLASSVCLCIICVLWGIKPIMSRFSIDADVSMAVIEFFFLAQMFNLSTGVIGQYILHLGYAKNLLYIGIAGAFSQLILFWVLGLTLGVEGALLGHALTNILLVLMKNIFGRKVFDIHGLRFDNLFIFFGAVAIYYAGKVLVPVSAGSELMLHIIQTIVYGVIVLIAFRSNKYLMQLASKYLKTR